MSYLLYTYCYFIITVSYFFYFISNVFALVLKCVLILFLPCKAYSFVLKKNVLYNYS